MKGEEKRFSPLSNEYVGGKKFVFDLLLSQRSGSQSAGCVGVKVNFANASKFHLVVGYLSQMHPGPCGGLTLSVVQFIVALCRNLDYILCIFRFRRKM